MVTPGEKEHAEMALNDAINTLRDEAGNIAAAAGVSEERVIEQVEELEMLKRNVEEKEVDIDDSRKHVPGD